MIQFYIPFNIRVADGTNVDLCLLVRVYGTQNRRPLGNNVNSLFRGWPGSFVILSVSFIHLSLYRVALSDDTHDISLPSLINLLQILIGLSSSDLRYFVNIPQKAEQAYI